MAISSDERTIVSGAADSVVTFWEDCTEEHESEKEAKRTELALKYVGEKIFFVVLFEADNLSYRDQDFMNYLALHDYKKAIQLALSMSQPGRLLSLFKDVISSSSKDDDQQPSIIGNPSVDEVIRTLGGSDLAKLLRFVRDWNTNAKTSTVAQKVLLTIVKLRSADEIIQAFSDETDERIFAEGGEASSQPPTTGRTALKELVDALIPYSERHLSRIEKLVQDSYVVDYILGEMDDGMFDDGFDDTMKVDTIGMV